MASRNTKNYKNFKIVVNTFKKPSIWLTLMVFIFIIYIGAGCFAFTKNQNSKDQFEVSDHILCQDEEGEISFHFLTLGNKYTGDCIYVKSGETDILIDAGSRVNSVDSITNYLNNYVLDGILEYVIVTHSDRDHIAGFSGASDSIFFEFECKTIIDFPRQEHTLEDATYRRYVQNRDAEVEAGAKHYTALECYKNQNGGQRVYDISQNVQMEILYNYYYENDSNDNNDYSVCVQFNHGERKYLFTGDLEENGEKQLIKYNSLSEVVLYKAGHHGSKTSSTSDLLDIIKPKICVCCCVAGTDEYTESVENQFPTQAFIDRISKHTRMVYVTSIGDTAYTNGKKFADFNGNIVISSKQSRVEVACSNSKDVLSESAWFKAKRICPPTWQGPLN